MKSTIRHGATLKCDVPSCTSSFTTYSVSSKVREQAALAGWSRLPGSQAFDAKGNALGSSKIKVDVCPACKPKPRMEGAAP